MDSVDKYLDTLYLKEELIQLNEVEFSSFLSKLEPESKTKKLTKNIKSSLNKKDPVKSLKKIKMLLNIVPKGLKFKSIEKIAVQKIDGYKKMKQTAGIVLKNSLPGMSKKINEFAATFLAVSSVMAKKKNKNLTPQQNLKNQIQDFVMQVRKFESDHGGMEDEKESKGGGITTENMTDIAVAWVIIAMSTAIAVGGGIGAYVLLTSLTGVLYLAIPAALFFGLMYLVVLFITKGKGS